MTRRRAPRATGALLVLLALLAASAASAGERILRFSTHVALQSDGSFDVFEVIAYSFGSAHKHGIYRDIPVAYGRGVLADYHIALDVLEVTDGYGDDVPYVLSREGDAQRIRIGDPDRTVTGEHTYGIRYRVRRGLLWFEAHDELYWNATGNGWNVPIDHAEASVTTPEDRAPVEPQALCFTGPHGSRESECEISWEGRTTRFETTRALAAREGLTLVVGLQKGVIEQPSRIALLRERAGDWISAATALPLLVFAVMGAHWWRNGRDPSGAAAIPVRYEPPEGLTPAELGVVLDQRADLRDISATLLDLAVRGVLRIEEIKGDDFLFLEQNDYVLHRLGRGEHGLKPFEQRLLAALFDGRTQVTVSSLHNQFYKSLPGIRDALYEEVSREPGAWFPTRPDAVRTRYVATALALGLPLAAFSLIRQSGVMALSFLACAVVGAGFGAVMPRRTRKGRRAHQHIRGFREFVRRVEVDRLERLGMREPQHFERLLPFAFVLGVSDAWAQAFADLYTEPPGWYHSHHGGAFRATSLVQQVEHALDVTASHLSSQPSGSGSSGFGGGGSSGGGFGGGGGGSW